MTNQMPERIYCYPDQDGYVAYDFDAQEAYKERGYAYLRADLAHNISTTKDLIETSIRLLEEYFERFADDSTEFRTAKIIKEHLEMSIDLLCERGK